MKWLTIILFSIFLVSCGEPKVRRTYDSESYKKMCQQKCQEKYKSDLDFVSIILRDCYCK